MLRKARTRLGTLYTLVGFGLAGCAGAGATRPASVSASTGEGGSDCCEPAFEVYVTGSDGWAVADLDGCAGGEAELRGYTAGGATFAHRFSVEFGSVTAALADAERGFIYVLDARMNVVLVHEIARALDRRFVLPAQIDPSGVALLDGGLALVVCASGPECRISTLSLRDPASSAAGVLP